jgi:hypothetical protein
MMTQHPDLTMAIARQHHEDLIKDADRRRRVRHSRHRRRA